jgi:hypothetical protein
MILEEIDGKVEVIKEAQYIEEVLKLKKHGKEFYDKALTYIFWMYCNESIYREMLTSQRKLYICKRHLGGEDINLYENNKDVKNFINLYEEIQCSREERLRKNVQNDMDDLITRIGNIKFTKIVTVEVPVEINGLIENKKVQVEIDNSKEKADALALSKSLISLSKELEQLIKIGSKNKKIEMRRRMFDYLPKTKK